LLRCRPMVLPVVAVVAELVMLGVVGCSGTCGHRSLGVVMQGDRQAVPEGRKRSLVRRRRSPVEKKLDM
jgi:hypothetical protein